MFYARDSECGSPRFAKDVFSSLHLSFVDFLFICLVMLRCHVKTVIRFWKGRRTGLVEESSTGSTGIGCPTFWDDWWERWGHSFNYGNNQRSCGMGSSSSWLGLAMRMGRGTPWRGRAGWEEQPTWNMRDLNKIIFDFQGEWSCWLPTWGTWQPGRRTKRATVITADLHHTTQVQMLLSLCLIVLSFLFKTSRVSF